MTITIDPAFAPNTSVAEAVQVLAVKKNTRTKAATPLSLPSGVPPPDATTRRKIREKPNRRAPREYQAELPELGNLVDVLA